MQGEQKCVEVELQRGIAALKRFNEELKDLAPGAYVGPMPESLPVSDAERLAVFTSSVEQEEA
jgi:hypothetical protein